MSIISLEALCTRALDAVERTDVRYLVFGGVALPAWGDVVATQDLDLVVEVNEGQVRGLFDTLRAVGFHFGENAEKLFLIDTWARATAGGRDLDLALGVTEFDRQALSRAVAVRLYGRSVPIASAEDLILYKLIAHRRKDLGHVEDIIFRQGTRLKLAYLREWARRIAETTGKHEIPPTLEKMLEEQGL